MSRARRQPSVSFANCGSAFVGVGVLSALVNVLMLTGAFYMLQIYDRVLPSRSVPTLIGLSILAVLLYAAYGFFDFSRARILLRVGRLFDERVSPHIIPLIARAPFAGSPAAAGAQPLRDLDQIRGFFAGGGVIALFDLPWLPFYLALCFLFHPLIGMAALGVAVLLAILTLLTDVLTRRAVAVASEHGIRRSSLAEAGRTRAEALAAMGMAGRIAALWGVENRAYRAAQEKASEVASGLAGLSRVARLVLQSGVLGLGAYLVIYGEASPGIIIASSIISARALAPVESAIAHWKSFVTARQGWTRLTAQLAGLPGDDRPLALARPETSLSVESLSVAAPRSDRPVVQRVSFRLAAGQGLGIIGPSGSGKSSLARALVGVWKAAAGTVRLDGAALDQWGDLGGHIGYLPQDVQLLDGTIAQNIGRFDPEAGADAIVRAARSAGVHDMILRLPKGYDTPIGESGAALSAGQRQRVALARALYGEPFLVVLDEPNSNLDAEGEAALQSAIEGVRARGGIAVVIAHRPSAVAAVDQLAVMNDGELIAVGPKDEVLRKVVRPAAQRPLAVGAA
jgi:PrtD family type I secretion system ABC transporter